jgi:hypothetical protein
VKSKVLHLEGFIWKFTCRARPRTPSLKKCTPRVGGCALFCKFNARGGAIISWKAKAFKKLKGSVYSPCLPPSSERARTSMENYETLGTIGEGCATARTGELLLVASLAAA